ncbi:hypothetical protein [Paenibacillus kobensis]|uniref:hypothetical protein n=1 Tax=Paenibacillus kobensis TaxID=59841 RepID=UPI000FDB2AED|nr:hypothetical protein [Paenibacillus kobensis]
MNLLPYYRSQFVANCLKHEEDWVESLLDDHISHWHRDRLKCHEFFRMTNHNGLACFEYSVTLPFEYFRAERQEQAYPRAVASELEFRSNEQYVLITYSMKAENINGSVLRFLFKARSEAAQSIDFTGGSVRKHQSAGHGAC